MRVLIVARAWSFHGGIETATANLLRALVAHGDEVHLLTPGASPPVPGVAVHRLRVPPLPPAARVVAIALLARRALHRRTWDVVQSHERTLGQDVYRAGEGCHRAYLEHRDDRGGRGLYHRAVLALERRIFATTPVIVAIARIGKEEIERLYGVEPGRVSVVYNGVDLERFHPANRVQSGAAARREADVSGMDRIVLYVGSGYGRNRLRTAIEALAKLDDKRFRLAVIGRDDETAYRALADQIGVGGRVLWLGARPDVEHWYAAADVVVLPTRYEPFGNVHLEALASGTPVVTSARAGGAEVIVEGVNGAVCEPHDAAAFAAGIERLSGQDASIRISAARASAEPFTYARHVTELRRVWERRPRANGDFP
jgi:UDP-glucose:(heptosyl)LPS alpha-1,3-glucosyltransferase